VTEYVERAAFLDQVQVGQRIRLVSFDKEPWVVTGIRREGAYHSLIGIRDDGSPVFNEGAGFLRVAIYKPIQEAAP
jgi:hypothetical protein